MRFDHNSVLYPVEQKTGGTHSIENTLEFDVIRQVSQLLLILVRPNCFVDDTESPLCYLKGTDECISIRSVFVAVSNDL